MAAIAWINEPPKANRVIQVKFLTTHPGSESGGGILIEHAVNLSDKAGYQGFSTSNRTKHRW
jgi:hypothetical protein